MIRDICKDELFLARKAAPASPEDLPIAQDLLETLIAHKDGCVGMAANMIGTAKRIIAVEGEDGYLVMFNPVILKKSGPYETEEGCLSLTGTRKTKRFQTIKVQWQNEKFQTRTKTFTGWTAEITSARDRPLRRHPHLRRQKPCGGFRRAFLLPEITWADGRYRRGCRRRRRGSGRSRSPKHGRRGRRRGLPCPPPRPSGLRGFWR